MSAFARPSLMPASPARVWRRRDRRGGASNPLLVAAASAVSLAALIPLGFIVWVMLGAGWQTVFRLVFRDRVGELLLNTVLLETITIPLSILLAVTLAWLAERTDLWGAKVWALLAVAPLTIPAFVHSYAWISVAPGLHGLAGGVLVSVLAYFPFLYLPVAAQLRRLDPAVEDVAASLGLGPWQVFFQAVLPQLRFAICGGSLLIGLHLLAEYGLYVMIQFDTFTTAIFDQFQVSFGGPYANSLAAVLVLCCFLLLAIEARARGNERYARVGAGSPRPQTLRSLGRAMGFWMLIPASTAALAIGVPLFTLARWLAVGGASVWHADEIGAALLQTVGFAVAGGVLATVVAIPMAWLSVRTRGRLPRALEACHYYAGSLPGVVIALALVAITVRVALPLYQTVVTAVFAYVLMFLPRALVGLRGSIAQVPTELEQAAMALGRTPAQAIWQITMRLALPGAAVSMALVALGITNELTATLMLAPNGTHTLATRFWAYSSEIDYAAASPYALMMLLLSLPMVFLLHAQFKQPGGG